MKPLADMVIWGLGPNLFIELNGCQPLAGVNRRKATLYFHKLRELIALKLAETEPWLSWEIEVEESYFGGSRKGKCGRGAAGKVPVFGLLKRGGKVHVVIIANAQQNTVIPIIRRTLEPDSMSILMAFWVMMLWMSPSSDNPHQSLRELCWKSWPCKFGQ
jgi:hypothetical protein